VPGDIDDDMAIVVIRTSSADLASWEGRFLAEPIRVSEARRLAYQTFLRWGMEPDQTDLACLLVSEVVTNVVLHAAATPPRRSEFLRPAIDPGAGHEAGPELGPDPLLADWPGGLLAVLDEDESNGHGPGGGKEFTLRLRRGESAVWVEVFDADLRLPRLGSASENDEGGRGLYLVDQLASRWGSRPTIDGKAVWFEIPLRAADLPGRRRQRVS
jgi:hypothetical protein